MNYRTMADLSALIIKSIDKIPTDIDLIVGVPRSGLLVANYLAVLMNKPITDFEGLFQNRLIATGSTKRMDKSIVSISECRKILILEDSVSSGESINKCKRRIAEACMDIEVIYCAAYVAPDKIKEVDIYFEILGSPRVFEWNIFHHQGVLKNACFDMDGVLCQDPSSTENDDGENYLNFLQTAKRKIIPTCQIGYIVTSRLEKYRAETEDWLKDNGVEYGQLIMLDATAEERREKGLHAKYKAEIYQKLNSSLFIESDEKQAAEIHSLTKKPVYCVGNNQFFDGNTKYKLRYESRKKLYRMLSRNKRIRKLYRTLRGILLERDKRGDA